MKKIHKSVLGILFIALILSFSFASAVNVNEVRQGKLYPGEQTQVDVDLKNSLGDDVTDVSLNLDLSNTQFIAVGSSEQSSDEIRDGKTETFSYTLKASQSIKPGDYNLPYTISFIMPAGNGTQLIQKKGVIGISVGARTEISYSALTDTPVVGHKGKVSLKIINTGLGDIKFVSVKLTPNGFSLLGSPETYIGTVSSNDFETASYDVIFKNENAKLSANVEYRDFDNKKIIENVDLLLNVYSEQKALELGIIQKNNAGIYISIAAIAVIAWLVYRTIRKRRKKKNQGA